MPDVPGHHLDGSSVLTVANHSQKQKQNNKCCFNGCPQEEFYSTYSSLEERFTKRPPQGENWNDVIERMMGFLEEVDKKHKGKTILIVSHKGPLLLLEGSVKKWSREKMLELKETGLSTAQFRELKE